MAEWLCLDELTSNELVLNCFHTSNTIELQERLNALAARRELWVPEFLQFLGINDQRVQIVCANDYAAALQSRELARGYLVRNQKSGEALIGCGNDLYNPPKYQRRSTMVSGKQGLGNDGQVDFELKHSDSIGGFMRFSVKDVDD